MRPFILAILTLAASSVAQGQTSAWVGQTVVMKYPKPLMANGHIVDNGFAYRIYTVKNASGKQLLLNSGAVSGWIDAADVVARDGAVEFYTQEIRRNPSNVLAHNLRALSWHHQGEIDRAILDYNEAIRLDPTNAAPYNNRGTAFMRIKLYDNAIADFDHVIEMNQNDPMPLNNRGTAWNQKKEYEKAIADFNAALRLDPKNVSAYCGRGDAWLHSGKNDLAAVDYSFAIGYDPTNPRVYNARGYVYKRNRDYEHALADFDEALRLDPKFGLAYKNRGQTRIIRKEYEQALADLGESIRFDPNGESLNDKAWLLATSPDGKLRDGAQAVELATRACTLGNWTNAGWLDTLAAAYAEAGNFDKAIETQEKALKLATATLRGEFEARLALYREQKPYRLP